MFVVNQFQGAIEAQSVVIKRAADRGAAEIPWHDCPQSQGPHCPWGFEGYSDAGLYRDKHF
jgi:hypothetical protein